MGPEGFCREFAPSGASAAEASKWGTSYLAQASAINPHPLGLPLPGLDPPHFAVRKEGTTVAFYCLFMVIEFLLTAGVILCSIHIIDSGHNALSPVLLAPKQQAKVPAAATAAEEKAKRDRLPAKSALEPLEKTLKSIKGAAPIAENEESLKKCWIRFLIKEEMQT